VLGLRPWWLACLPATSLLVVVVSLWALPAACLRPACAPVAFCFAVRLRLCVGVGAGQRGARPTLTVQKLPIGMSCSPIAQLPVRQLAVGESFLGPSAFPLRFFITDYPAKFGSSKLDIPNWTWLREGRRKIQIGRSNAIDGSMAWRLAWRVEPSYFEPWGDEMVPWLGSPFGF